MSEKQVDKQDSTRQPRLPTERMDKSLRTLYGARAIIEEWKPSFDIGSVLVHLGRATNTKGTTESMLKALHEAKIHLEIEIERVEKELKREADERQALIEEERTRYGGRTQGELIRQFNECREQEGLCLMNHDYEKSARKKKEAEEILKLMQYGKSKRQHETESESERIMSEKQNPTPLSVRRQGFMAAIGCAGVMGSPQIDSKNGTGNGIDSYREVDVDQDDEEIAPGSGNGSSNGRCFI